MLLLLLFPMKVGNIVVSSAGTSCCPRLTHQTNLDPDKTNPPDDDVKQARAFERLMALSYLNQSDNFAETTRTMLKTQFFLDHDEYPLNITVAANLIKAAKKESRPDRGKCAVLTLAQRFTRSTYSPSAEHTCLLCGAPDHW